MTPAEQYRAGWDASKRSTTFDLDAAEARFDRKHPEALFQTWFAAGWIDYAADRPFGHALMGTTHEEAAR